MGHPRILMWVKAHQSLNAFTVLEFSNIAIHDQKKIFGKIKTVKAPA